MFRVAIDPGHGGKDPGAVGFAGLKEKDVNLAIARNLQAELERHGVIVTMTRDTDKAVNPAAKNDTEELQARCNIANTADADIFISIHCNSFSDPASLGTETWVLAMGGQAEELAKSVHSEVIAVQKARDRGIRAKRLYVLKNTNMPAILVENLFISNPYEEKRLGEPEFRRVTAQAIARGILSFVGARYVPPPSAIPDIELLQAEIAQLKRERDAAIAEVNEWRVTATQAMNVLKKRIGV